MIDCRRFLASTVTGGLVAGLALKHDLFAQLEQIPSALPDSNKFAANEDAYWAELRKQFLIPADEVYLNNGTVGSSPAPVLRAVFDGYYASEKLNEADPEDYPIWGYASWNQFRDPLAEFVGCKRDEIALLRNATEANSYIANGLDMKPGDEVLMTDQEHPGGESPWEVKAKRYGVVIKKVTLPKPVQNAAQVLNLFNDAITPRTRVMFFSHISTITGVVLPAKELCALARSKGILSAVDGAHVPGMMRFNVHDIGCDMYSSSPHKWLQARRGLASYMFEMKSSTACGIRSRPKDGTNLRSVLNGFSVSAARTSLHSADFAPQLNSQTTLDWIASRNVTAPRPTTCWQKCKSAVQNPGRRPIPLCAAESSR